HPPPTYTLFPYTTLFRSVQTAPGASSLQQQAATYETARTFIQAPDGKEMRREPHHSVEADVNKQAVKHSNDRLRQDAEQTSHERSEEHTSELQSLAYLVC